METTEKIETSLNHYFSDIMFELRQDKREDIHRITQFIPSLVTHDQNDLLMKPITLLEVEEVFFQMKEQTTRGPDGFMVKLFH